MEFKIEGNRFLKDGKPFKVISGAVHYFRNLPDTWDDIFEKLVALGCNTVETYCVWNMHEKTKGEFDFSGILDIVFRQSGGARSCGDRSPRSVYLRGVGVRRTSLVAANGKGHGDPLLQPHVYQIFRTVS